VACVGASTAAAGGARLSPPTLSLKSAAGTQLGAQGSYCVGDSSQNICADGAQPHPSKVTVVRPGGRLVLKTFAATLSEPSVALVALGCEGFGRPRALHQRNGVWQVRAPRRRGAYELQVFARFRTEHTSGDTSVGFGVLVSRSKARRIVPAAPYEVC
jgi:hypothetical protein